MDPDLMPEDEREARRHVVVGSIIPATEAARQMHEQWHLHTGKPCGSAGCVFLGQLLAVELEAPNPDAIHRPRQLTVPIDIKDPVIVSEKRLQKLKVDLSENQLLFDQRWEADMRAIKRWQQAHPGNELVWPDHTDMVVWLLEQAGKVKALIEEAAVYLEPAAGRVDAREARKILHDLRIAVGTPSDLEAYGSILLRPDRADAVCPIEGVHHHQVASGMSIQFQPGHKMADVPEKYRG